MTLASSLRARDDAALELLLTRRPLTTRGRVKDFFDLAEALLDPVSIRAILTHLDRHTLAVLAASTHEPLSAEQLADRLETLGADHVAERADYAVDVALLTRTANGYAALSAVTGVLDGWPKAGLPGLVELSTERPPAVAHPHPVASASSIDPSAAEHAFATTTATAELIVELLAHPARELGKGGPALPERRRLAHAMQVNEPTVDRYLDLAVRSGLASHEPGGWHPTATGEAWLRETTADRWAALATAWLEAIPVEVRSVLSERTSWGDALHAYAHWLYPAGGEWIREAVDRVATHASLLGITSGPSPAEQLLSTPGSLLLTSDATAAASAMAHFFPSHVRQVYLQHDLSIIAPGPLHPELDLKLRAFAELETRAQAYSYRLSPESVNRALSAGGSAEEMLAFLEKLSLTGIPQPVHYLISQAAARFGTVRVGLIPAGTADVGDAQSYVRSTDSSMIGLLEVDQAIGPIGLRPHSSLRLVSRFEFEVVFWALSDARYPVAAENPDGSLLSVRRQRVTSVPVHSTAPDHSELLKELRAAEAESAGDSGQAWVARQLDAAIRAKQTVTVTVQVPGSGPLEFVLEPTGVSGGRLRARDKRADIERTLPLSSILELK
ncbi:hypothetical protein GCM10011313_02580 [Mycetocola zhadangensis]|nr:helicase-associated domain-containing protein [Mycetocola zhadangensis]GGE83661.1 hypothetical protein GCM10011313_02580 [Mycetocola zhadangensis]